MCGASVPISSVSGQLGDRFPGVCTGTCFVSPLFVLTDVVFNLE